MVTVQKRKPVAQPIYFEGPAQSIRANCKTPCFADGATGQIDFGVDYIDIVLVSTEICLGPLPSIDTDKLRDKDGPLQYQQGNGLSLSKATDQELAEAIYTHLLKVRGVIYGFMMPSTYDSLPSEAQALINQKLILSSNFHGVSVDRSQGGFSTYLFNLATSGKAIYEVVTRIYFDASHTGATGDIIQGLFFQAMEPETDADIAFLSEVKTFIESSDEDIHIERPWILSQCDVLENYYQQKALLPMLKVAKLAQILGQNFTYDPSGLVKDATYSLTGADAYLLDGAIEAEVTETEVTETVRTKSLTENLPF